MKNSNKKNDIKSIILSECSYSLSLPFFFFYAFISNYVTSKWHEKWKYNRMLLLIRWIQMNLCTGESNQFQSLAHFHAVNEKSLDFSARSNSFDMGWRYYYARFFTNWIGCGGMCCVYFIRSQFPVVSLRCLTNFFWGK